MLAGKVLFDVGRAKMVGMLVAEPDMCGASQTIDCALRRRGEQAPRFVEDVALDPGVDHQADAAKIHAETCVIGERQSRNGSANI